MRQINLWKIYMMRLILKEVIMSDRHMSDEQLYLFFQLFLNTEKISLN